MANARSFMVARTGLMGSGTNGMSADELLEIMCANSADRTASIYNEDITDVAAGTFGMPSSNRVIGVNNWIQDAVLPNCESVGNCSFYACKSMTNLELPALVTCGSYAFYNCSALEELELPNCTTLKAHAFGLCSGLKRLSLPALTSVSTSAFSNLSSLEELDLGDCVGHSISLTGANPSGFTVRIKNGASDSSSYGLLSSIPATVTGPVKIVFYGDKIGNWVLYGQTHEIQVEASDSVTTIGDGSFASCTGLTDLPSLPGVTSWSKSCFSGCGGLTSITIPRTIDKLPHSCFLGCTGLTSVVVPENVTQLESLCFGNITARIDFYGPVRSIKTYTSGVLGNGEVHFHNEEIPAYAFHYDQTSECDVVIEDTVKHVNIGCFYGCSKIKSVTIGKGVTSWTTPGGGTSQTFSGCIGLTSVIIKEGLTTLKGAYMFYRCTALTEIVIPDSVTILGDNMFSFCTALSSVTLSRSLSELPGECFQSCESLASIVIPDSVVSLGGDCFSRCIGLTTITIPEHMTTIGIGCFSNCTGLTSMTVLAVTPPQTGRDAFSGVNKEIPVYVPAGSVSAYRASSRWSEFTNIQAIP